MNGNFDGDFFRTTFLIGPDARQLESRPDLPLLKPRRPINPLLLPARVTARLLWAALGFALYGLQLPLAVAAARWAAGLMTLASAVA